MGKVNTRQLLARTGVTIVKMVKAGYVVNPNMYATAGETFR